MRRLATGGVVKAPAMVLLARDGTEYVIPLLTVDVSRGVRTRRAGRVRPFVGVALAVVGYWLDRWTALRRGWRP